MKKNQIKKAFLIPALIAGLGLILAGRVTAQNFTNLHNFSGFADGSTPLAGLIVSGNTLYGTAHDGGSSFNGTVFKVNLNGTGFTNLHVFNGAGEGAHPKAGLLLVGILYGTANSGGSSSVGTVFAVHTDSTGFTNLHTFIFSSDGANPQAGLILSGNSVYGTAYNGGGFGNGTMFSLSLGSVSAPAAPTLTIFPSGTNVVLTWPTNAVGFTLQSTTNLVSPAIWITNSAAPVVVNGQNAVTNPASGTKKFYRLSQ